MILYSIHIPNWHPPSLNKFVHKHWGIGTKLKKDTLKIVHHYASQANIPYATTKRSLKLIITLGKGDRACDPDNYNKKLLDALVDLKYLRDDSHHWLAQSPTEFKRGNKSTTIILSDL